MALYDFATRMQNEEGAFFNMPKYEHLHLGHSNKRMETNLSEASYVYHERPSVKYQIHRKAGFKGWRTRRSKMNLSPHKGKGHPFKFIEPATGDTIYVSPGFWD